MGRFDLSPWSLAFPLFLLGVLFYWKKVDAKLLSLMVVMVAVGVIFDSLMAIKNLVVFTQPDSFFIPVWLISIWWLFILLIPVMVPVFFSRLALAALLGAILAPSVMLQAQRCKFCIYKVVWRQDFMRSFGACIFPLSFLLPANFFPRSEL